MTTTKTLRLAVSALACALLVGPLPAGALTIYTTSAAFHAANPGLPTEDFEGAPVLGVNFSGPIDSTAPVYDLGGNLLYAAGDLLPGAQYADSLVLQNPLAGGGLRLMVLDTGVALTTPRFDTTLNVLFPAGTVTAAGLDVYQLDGLTSPTTLALPMTVDVFGPGGALLTHQVITSHHRERRFFGISLAPGEGSITRIEVNDGMIVPAIDNVSFGLAPVPEPAPLAELGAGLAGIAALGRRRRRG